MSKRFSQQLLTWFDAHGRKDLPWQKHINPYRIWVSEIMLQQTQVTTVIPYFERFMQRFPTITSLAKASLDDVLALWAGLGYYARAKHLHKTAQTIISAHQGKFPTRFEEVIALPGIGRSTAGAILSISTEQRFAILDGNVKRVLSRYFAIPGWPGEAKITEQLWGLAEKLTPFRRVNHYTQAIMDLGATLCTRAKPNCAACPVARTCQAKRLNLVKNFPESRPKQEKPTKPITLLMIVQTKNKQQEILLEKRPTNGIWGGLWSLPECNVKENIKEFLEKHFNLKTERIKKILKQEKLLHTFTHFHLNIHPQRVEIMPRTTLKLKPQYHWHPIAKLSSVGLPAPVKRILSALTV